MSLLASTSATHTVVVVLRTRGVDGRRSPTFGEIGRVTLPCRITPASSTDSTRLGGVSVATIVKLVCGPGTFPGDALSLVIVDGVEHEIVGDVIRHRSSRATAADIVYLAAKGITPPVIEGA